MRTHAYTAYTYTLDTFNSEMHTHNIVYIGKEAVSPAQLSKMTPIEIKRQV